MSLYLILTAAFKMPQFNYCYDVMLANIGCE